MSNTPSVNELKMRIVELENKLAKTQLQEQENSEIRLSSIINESPFPIAIADRNDEKILYWSRSAKKKFGHSPKTVSEWSELAYPDKAYRKKLIQQWKPKVKKALETGKAVNAGAYKITCQDGSVKICELYVQLIPDNLIITFNEITESKKAEEAFIKHQAILKNAEEISDLGSFELDIAKDIFTFSEGWMRIHGCTKNTFTLEELLPIAHPEDHPKVQQAFDGAIKHLKPYQVEHRIIRQDNGQIRNIRSSAKVICDNQGAPLKLYGSVQDITDRKKAEQSLKESENNLRFLNNMTREALQMKDIKNIYDYISSSLQKLLPDTIVLFLSVDYASKNTCLENVSGLKNHLFEKILTISGVNPVGKSFKLLRDYDKLYRTGKLVEFKNGLVDFSAGQFPALATKSIEKIIDLHKIYTIGISNEHDLLANLHFLTFNKKEISNADFIEAFVKQAGMILQIKQAEQSLKESEERYRKAQKLGKVGNWEYNPHTSEFWASEETKHIFGFDPKETHFTTESVESCIPDRRRVNKALIDLIENDTEYNLEYEILTHDTGEQKNIVSHAELEKDERGIPLRVTGVIQDITIRKQANQALKESEKEYRLLVDNLGEGIAGTVENEYFVFANKAAENIFGVKSGDLIGRTLQDFVSEKEFNKVKKETLKRKKGEKSSYELEITNAKNEQVRLMVTASPRYDDTGNYKSSFAVFRDITVRKKAQEALKVNESRLSSLVTIFQKEFNSKQELLDLTLEEAVKLTGSKLGFISFYDNETEKFNLYSWSKGVMEESDIDKPQTIFNLQDTGIWGETVRQEKPIIINDFQAPNPLKEGYPKGHLELYKFLGIPIKIDKDIVAVVCVANKKTDYKQDDILHLTILMKNTWSVLQKQEKDEFIQKQNRELTKLNEDKDKFMSVLAHDLKNPFNTLLGFSELLNKNILTYDIDKIEKQVKIINSTAHNTYHLLEDILLWSRSQSGKITYEPGDFDLEKACKSIVKEANSRALSKGIKIKYNVSDQLQVYTDINLVKIILRNLISNAIKFTNQGGAITIDAKETGNETIVSVTDTGIGIKKETIPELFNIAMDNTRKGTQNEEGTGLGLQICKDFVEKMGGKIWVESEVGNLPAGSPAESHGKAGGSIFYFTIPK